MKFQSGDIISTSTGVYGVVVGVSGSRLSIFWEDLFYAHLAELPFPSGWFLVSSIFRGGI